MCNYMKITFPLRILFAVFNMFIHSVISDLFKGVVVTL